MLVQSIPYPAVAGFSGASAFRNTSQNVESLSAVPWAGEQYDTENYFSNAANTIFTIPQDGVYSVRTQIFAFNGNFINIQRNGAAFNGAGFYSSPNLAPSLHVISAPVFCSAGDTFRVVNGSGGSMDVAHLTTSNVNWFAIERRPSGVRYAVVRKTSDQALSANTFTTATWQNELADVGGWFDGSSDNTRFTVPSGVQLVRLTAGMITSDTGTGPSGIALRLNGSVVVGLPRATAQATSKRVSAVSAIIPVSAGDFFEYRVFSTAASNLLTSTATWFAIEEVTDNLQRVLVTRDATFSVGVATTVTIAWNAETYKTQSGMHSNTTNNSRLVVPAGCSRARLTVNVRNTAGTTGAFEVDTLKNGAVYPGRIFLRTDSRDCNASSDWIDVVDGDYFEIRVTTGSQTFTSEIVSTWACLECI
jgi:hypothetical protein